MLWNAINNLNTSKLFSGIIMILLNIGSKYVTLDISKTQESFLSNIIIRRLLVFTIVFTATRDLIISLILTAVFIVLVSGLFNENSRTCLIPKKFHILKNDNISQEEIEHAKYILEQSKINNKNKTQYELELENKKKKINNFRNKTKKIRERSNMLTNIGMANLLQV